jgi:hypothetical protein
MAEQIFIRLRGRIQGPFSAEQLKSMSKRGQFSRMHEVSNDGMIWGRATMRPELFDAGQTEVVFADLDPAPEPPPALPQSLPPADVWYYHQMGVNQGPVDLDQLQFLANSAQIGPMDLVWKQGLPEWLPAARVPGLFKTTGAPVVQTPVYGRGSYDPQGRSEESQSVSGLGIASLIFGILGFGGLGTILAFLPDSIWSLEVATLLLGVLGFGGPVSLMAITFGAISLYQISVSRGKVTGTGLAVAGLVLGIVLLSLQIIVLVKVRYPQ